MKQRPVGLCGICGNYAYKHDDIGQPCHAHHQGELCSGFVKDASAESAWEICPACAAKGLEQAVACPQCAGAGWLPVT